MWLEDRHSPIWHSMCLSFLWGKKKKKGHTGVQETWGIRHLISLDEGLLP